ncbi:MAG: glutamate--tRNA ligase [Myxococcota bacterium]|jgi:glutamyl-tRNA synthetase|nr:glutamate--tRNA ligase [Myxococcota bacterium]
MSNIRTRFAPSPTGFLHLGSARTALFNWAYARHHGGTFVLRIEDTDRERSTAESEAGLIEGLQWLGLDWDEGPFRQSDRADRHTAVIEQLLAEGKAYRCVCTRDELEDRKQAVLEAGGKWTYDGRCRDAGHGPDCGEHTVRLRLPEEGMLGWDDLVFGPSGQDASEIGDKIIRRSGGDPLFHLTVVVDDFDMGITHVIRGADHHPNTPFQIAIYEAMGAPLPHFAHVPLIVGPSGKKLSKRRDPVSIEAFREQGYLPEGLRNWLVRLGWSHGDDELFSREEIIEKFDLDGVGRASGQADPDKLAWVNQQHIKDAPLDTLMAGLEAQWPKHLDKAPEHDERLALAIDLNRERAKTLDEMASLCAVLLRDEVDLRSEASAKAVKKHLKVAALPLVESLYAALSKLDVEEWSESQLESVFEAVAAHHDNVKLGKIAQPVRVAVTGGPISPGIYETMIVIGRSRCLPRLERAIEVMRERAEQAG